MLVDVIITGILGGLIYLDRTAAFQVMIHRPLIAGPIIGLILGSPITGLSVGVLVELLWISRPPLGGYMPPNECLAAILTTGSVIIAASPAEPSRAFVVLGLLIVIPPVRFLFPSIESGLRRLNGRLAENAALSLSRGAPPNFFSLNMMGLLFTYIAASLFILLLLPLLVLAIEYTYPRIPGSVVSALDWMYFCLPLIGVSSILGTINVKRSGMVFALAFAGAMFFFII